MKKRNLLLLATLILALSSADGMTLIIRQLKPPHRIVNQVHKLPNRGLVIRQVEGTLQLSRLTSSAAATPIAAVPFDMGTQYYEVRRD